MHYHTAYLWLEVQGGMWKAIVAFTLGSALTAALGLLPWRRHRQAQKRTLDALDTTTPGGLQVIAELLRKEGERP